MSEDDIGILIMLLVIWTIGGIVMFLYHWAA